jgi:hypothetical protein
MVDSALGWACSFSRHRRRIPSTTLWTKAPGATTANRGGDRELPDDIDAEHGERGHATFGGGIHRCLGSHLARRELRLVVEEFHKLIPDYEVAPGVQPKVVWPSSTLHLESLPLIFPPAGSKQ